MELDDCKPNLRVRYIPRHAFGGEDHKDIEDGVISSRNDKYVFVKFDKQIVRLGSEGVTPQACNPKDLVLL